MNQSTGSLEYSQLAGLQDVLRVLWGQKRPNEPFEAGFLKMAGCHPNTLTEGEVNYSKRHGLSFTFYGVTPDEKWVDVILEMPHKGEWGFYGYGPESAELPPEERRS